MADQAIKALLDFASFDEESVHPQSLPPDFEALEAEIADRYPSGVALTFPPAVRALYQWSFTEAQIGPVRLIDAPAGAPLQTLREQIFDYYEPAAIAGAGLLIIADDANDGGPFCLRAQECIPAGQWSVWLWDHEHQGVTDRLFSSADKMIEVLLAIQAGSTVISAAELDPGTDLADSYGWWDEE